MTHYTRNENSVRVDFFKSSGKWYETEAVEFLNSTYHGDPSTALRQALYKHFGDTPRMLGMTVVCLHPYVQNPYPVSIVNWG